MKKQGMIDHMEITKAAIVLDGENITFEIPFTKVDAERRLVSGFATIDNPDSQGDIVTQEASLKAFKRFRGNVREMHQPIAVGKVIDYRPDSVVDKVTGQVYQGVYVSVYISKGAQATWEKVIDGTLSGFSIGGGIKKAEPIYSEKADAVYRKIDEYDLVELSLVDNPANKLANVLIVQKSDEISSDVEKSIVHWCDTDGILSVANKDASRCPSCNKTMQPIGFIEQEPTKEVLKGILNKFKDETGGVIPAFGASTEIAVDDIAKSTENPTKEETMAEEAAVVEETQPTEVAKSDSPSGEADLVKAVAEVTEGVKQLGEALAGLSVLADTLKSLTATVDEMKKSLDSVSGTVTEVKSEVAAVKGEVEKFDERVEAVEADTAVRKSGDVGGVAEPVQKSPGGIWKGAFLGSTGLFS